jgi:hypothetical protein
VYICPEITAYLTISFTLDDRDEATLLRLAVTKPRCIFHGKLLKASAEEKV